MDDGVGLLATFTAIAVIETVLLVLWMRRPPETQDTVQERDGLAADVAARKRPITGSTKKWHPTRKRPCDGEASATVPQRSAKLAKVLEARRPAGFEGRRGVGER